MKTTTMVDTVAFVVGLLVLAGLLVGFYQLYQYMCTPATPLDLEDPSGALVISEEQRLLDTRSRIATIALASIGPALSAAINIAKHLCKSHGDHLEMASKALLLLFAVIGSVIWPVTGGAFNGFVVFAAVAGPRCLVDVVVEVRGKMDPSGNLGLLMLMVIVMVVKLFI